MNRVKGRMWGMEGREIRGLGRWWGRGVDGDKECGFYGRIGARVCAK